MDKKKGKTQTGLTDNGMFSALQGQDLELSVHSFFIIVNST